MSELWIKPALINLLNIFLLWFSLNQATASENNELDNEEILVLYNIINPNEETKFRINDLPCMTTEQGVYLCASHTLLTHISHYRLLKNIRLDSGKALENAGLWIGKNNLAAILIEKKLDSPQMLIYGDANAPWTGTKVVLRIPYGMSFKNFKSWVNKKGKPEWATLIEKYFKILASASNARNPMQICDGELTQKPHAIRISKINNSTTEVAAVESAEDLPPEEANEPEEKQTHEHPLSKAIRECNPSEIEKTIKRGVDLSELHSIKQLYNVTPTFLGAAAVSGCSSAIDILINYGADINELDNYGNTPLMEAIAFGEVTTVKKLLDLGADTTIHSAVTSRTALDIAKASNQKKILTLLEQHGDKE